MARETLQSVIVDADKHLLPDFDVSKEKVAAIRGLLLEHNIAFKANDKKADLVALFNAQIKPKSAALLRSRMAVQGSSRGITRISSKQTQSAASSDSDTSSAEEVVIPSKRSHAPSAKQEPVKKVKANDRDKADLKRRRTSGFSDINAFQGGSDSSPDAGRKKRKSSIGAATPFNEPDGEEEEEEPEARPLIMLPAPIVKSKSPKQLKVPSPPHKPRLSSPLRNPATSPQQTGATNAITKSPSVPRMKQYVNLDSMREADSELARLQKQVEALQDKPKRSKSEERTLESILSDFDKRNADQLNSNSARRSSGTVIELGQPKSSKQPEINRRKSYPAKSPLARMDNPTADAPPTPLRKALILNKKKLKPALVQPKTAANAAWATLTALFLTYLLWWRSERLNLGYCDSNSHTNAIMNARNLAPASKAVQPFADTSRPIAIHNALSIRPSCMPCPMHAYCNNGQLIACDRDYYKTPSTWTALTGSLLPFPERCLPDTEKLIRVAEIASGVAGRLRRHKGSVICQRPFQSVGKGNQVVVADEARKFGLTLHDLKKEFGSKRNPKLSVAVWEDYFANAVADLVSHGEAIREVAPDSEEVYLATLEADLPLWCRAQRTSYEYASQRKTELGGLLSILFAFWWIKSAFQQHQAEKARVKELANLAMRALRDQKRRYNQAKIAGKQNVDPFWSQLGMRDHILSAEHNLAVRQRLWKQVSKIVEGNDNVRLYEMEVDGQPGVRTWDWSGSTDEFSFDLSPGKQTRFDPKVESVYPRLEES